MLVLLVPTFATAQQVIPPSVDPGRIEERLRPAPTPPAARPELRLPEMHTQPAPEDAERIRFRLAGVVVTGSTVYDANAFLPYYADHLDTMVTLADIYAIAERITARYRNDGNVLSQAIVPAQRISEGIVTIQAVEGFIDHIEIDNENGTDIDRVRAYAARISRSRPLRQAVLERYLLLIRDLPGINARTVLSPSATTPGAADLTLIVSRETVRGSATIDNRGTRFLGPVQATLSTDVNGVFDADERISLLHVVTPDDREMRYFYGRVDLPVGSDGVTIHALADLTRSRPGHTLEPLEIRGTSDSVALGIAWPAVRSRSENLTLSAQFEAKNSQTNLFIDQRLTRDRIRPLRATARYDRIDTWRGRNTVTATLSHGLDALGASRPGDANLSRANGNSRFTKLDVTTTRDQRVGERWSLFALVTGQKSADTLLAAEEFGVGGSVVGSAHDPSEITGDDGVAFRAELRRTVTATRVGGHVYGYYDIGKVWNRDPGPGEPSSGSLASTGVGARLAFGTWLSAQGELARPLTRPVAARGDDGGDWRAFFSVTARF